jgi:hypothetical protein
MCFVLPLLHSICVVNLLLRISKNSSLLFSGEFIATEICAKNYVHWVTWWLTYPVHQYFLGKTHGYYLCVPEVWSYIRWIGRNSALCKPLTTHNGVLCHCWFTYHVAEHTVLVL